MARKLRNLELAAGQIARPGTRGSAYANGTLERRQAERASKRITDASFLGYDTILIEDGTATTSPDYCVAAAL